MKIAIVGYGSIGQRHVRNFEELGAEVSVVSRSSKEHSRAFSSLVDCVAKESPDIVFICTETANHLESYNDLVGVDYRGTVIFEKPVFSKTENDLKSNNFANCLVSYNLRLHPLIQELKSFVQANKVYSVQAHVGQDLRTWRETDYRKSYSATKEQGGGVLRDLSHEIDFISWVFGRVKTVMADVKKVSDLEINVEDSVSLLFETENCQQVNLQMNYLDSPVQRYIRLQTEKGTAEFDFIKSAMSLDGVEKKTNVERNDTYINLSKKLLEGDVSGICTFDEGLAVLKVIEGSEESSSLGKRIEL